MLINLLRVGQERANFSIRTCSIKKYMKEVDLMQLNHDSILRHYRDNGLLSQKYLKFGELGSSKA